MTVRSACMLGALLLGCGGDESAAEDAGPPLAEDAQVEVDAAPPLVCDPGLRHANREGPFACPSAPEFATVTLRGRSFDMFRYEASHPMATGDVAFPCAVSQGQEFQAPPGATEACSTADVRPWHTVKWGDADAACSAIGWRLCSGEELLQACAGEEDNAYVYGSAFEAGQCNFREQFRPEGSELGTEAPTGSFADCTNPDGIADLSGNVWEWTNDRDDSDARARSYQGAGWKTIPERHRDTDLTCDARTALPRLTAPTFANPDVGFRCCRDQ